MPKREMCMLSKYIALQSQMSSHEEWLTRKITQED
jgi:hypothetical protein